MKKPLIIIAGPTASGKTDLSIELAKEINGEIISADSMQVYKYMDIGTAKPTKDEMQGIKHYMIDELMPDEEFNVAVFQQRTKKYYNEIIEKGKIPIIVGGTGFYIQSVIYDIDFEETIADEEYREKLMNISKEKGNEHLHNMLKEVDAISAKNIHPNNVKRIIRALEYYKQTNLPISEHNEKERKKESPYNLAFFVLNMNRELLYDRINRRVDIMVEQGLKKEVEKLINMGYNKDLVSMQGLGYKEIIDYLDGQYSFEEAIYILKRDTRHFAKRQLTWFRREKDTNWLEMDKYSFDKEKILRNMLNYLEVREIII